MPVKRVILMYISEISGHHSATLAIEKAIKTLSPQTEVLNINAFNYTNPITEKVINRLYMAVIKRTPQIWEYLYDNQAVIKKLETIKKGIHKFNSPKLKSLFDRFKPQAIACTQAFPCGMVADFKKNYDCNIPLLAVLTDYVPHSYWVYDTIDYYITPSEEIGMRLVKKGVLPEKIKPFGIPFDLKFNEPTDKIKLMHKLRLDPKAATILIMGGGQGLGPIKKIIKSLEDTKSHLQEIVITGNNKKLYKSITRKIRKYNKKIIVLGYVNNINELMDIADLIIKKPGGLTTAEALTKKLPILILNPIPGQEANNTKYLTTKGAAIRIDDAEKINSLIDQLFTSPNKLDSLREAAGRISKPKASLDIAKLILSIDNV